MILINNVKKLMKKLKCSLLKKALTTFNATDMAENKNTMHMFLLTKN